jgi:hypothetical protein
MEIIKSAFASSKQNEILYKLCNTEYPKKLNYTTITDFSNYLNNLKNLTHYLPINNTKEIARWAFTFSRQLEIWFGVILNFNF